LLRLRQKGQAPRQDVVAGNQRFEVSLASGRRRPAALVEDFPPKDLAAVRLEGATPPAAAGKRAATRAARTPGGRL
jgi:hypothetical protein